MHCFCSGDEVERSIEFLDKVLSEFEDPDSLPHIVEHQVQEPETPTQGNQSEDDGYMSMNGKKWVFQSFNTELWVFSEICFFFQIQFLLSNLLFKFTSSKKFLKIFERNNQWKNCSF